VIEHEVVQGECFHSIATDYGFFWESLWNHPANAELRRLRKDPSVVNPGDVVRIPEKSIRWDDGPTETRHRFRRKGQPARVRIQVRRNDEPRANEPYSIEIDGRLEQGTLDANGMLDVPIVPNAQRAVLRVGEGDNQEVFPLVLGHVDTIDTERGARERLRCLGFDGDEPDFAELLKSYQRHRDLEPTGQLDQATKDRLTQDFGE
jgi:hypothetical protein